MLPDLMISLQKSVIATKKALVKLKLRIVVSKRFRVRLRVNYKNLNRKGLNFVCQSHKTRKSFFLFYDINKLSVFFSQYISVLFSFSKYVNEHRDLIPAFVSRLQMVSFSSTRCVEEDKYLQMGDSNGQLCKRSYCPHSMVLLKSCVSEPF